MKPGKLICIRSNGLKSKTPGFSIGFNSLNFSRWIFSKYDTLYRFDKLPVLIFRKLPGGAAKNSSYSRPFINHISFQNFRNFRNQCQKNLIFLNNSVLSACHIRACTKIRTSTSCYSPAHLYPEVNQYHYAVYISGNIDAKTGRHSKFLKNIGYEKTKHEQLRKKEEQLINVFYKPLLYSSNILTLVNPVTSSHLQRVLKLCHVRDLLINSEKVSTSPLFEENIERSDKRFLCTKNILTSINPVINRNFNNSTNVNVISYLQKTFKCGFLGFKSYRIIAGQEKVNKDSMDIGVVVQGTNMSSILSAGPVTLNYVYKEILGRFRLEPDRMLSSTENMAISLSKKPGIFRFFNALSLRQIRNSKGNENNIFVRVEKRTKQLVADLHSLYFSAKTVMAPITQVMIYYLQRMFNFGTSTNVNFMIRETSPSIFKNKEINSEYENNIPEQVGERRKEFLTASDQSNTYTGNILTPINLVLLSYLQRALNFNNPISVKVPTQDIHMLSFKKMVIDSKYYNTSEQFVERKQELKVSFNKRSLCPKNILIPANPVINQNFNNSTYVNIISYLQKMLSFEFFDSKSDRKVVSPGKIDKTLMGINISIQNTDALSVLSADPVILGYMHNRNVKISITEFNRVIYAAKKVGIAAGKSVPSLRNDFLSLRQTRNLKNDDYNASGKIGNRIKQLIKDLYIPDPSTGAIIKSVNPVTLGYLQSVLNFKTINSELDQFFFGLKAISKASNTLSAAPQEIDSSSFQQIRKKQGLQYGYFFNRDAKLTGRNVIPAFQTGRLLKGNVNPSYDNFFSKSLTGFEYARQFTKKNRLPDVYEDLLYSSKELVLKKAALQKAEIISENTEETQTEKISSSRKQEFLAKELAKEKPMHELDMIANRVYKIIERRISIEKDRRGLF